MCVENVLFSQLGHASIARMPNRSNVFHDAHHLTSLGRPIRHLFKGLGIGDSSPLYL